MNETGDVSIFEKFQEPKKRFWLRSRKRPKSDAISISSMDISIDSVCGKKKRRRITEVASNIFFSLPSVSGSEKKRKRASNNQLDASFLSFPGTDVDNHNTTLKQNELAGNVAIRSWMVDIADSNLKDLSSTLSRREVKRQEAIYELYCGENVLLNDLSALRESYYEPLLSLDIFNTSELDTLFGNIDSFIELHSELRDNLVKLRDQSGFTDIVGPTIINWFLQLETLYIERCRKQIWARHLLESRKLTNKRFQEFIKKKLETSHAVDLWTYLDVPRSRVVKYPLLVKEILKHTPSGHPDEISLKESREILLKLLNEIDKAMGDAECQLAKTKINPKGEFDGDKCVENAAQLITEGQLRDSRGMKYHCFLFDTCLALTRPIRRSARKYNLSFPIVTSKEFCQDINSTSQNSSGFKVGKHNLYVDDEHQKRHWIDALKRVFRFSSNEAENAIEKENENHFQKVDLKKRTKEMVRENNFSFTLRRNLLRPKLNNSS